MAETLTQEITGESGMPTGNAELPQEEFLPKMLPHLLEAVQAHTKEEMCLQTSAPQVPPELSQIIRGLAGKLHARLPQGCGIEMADLIQSGNVGYLKAAGTYESHHGPPLALYAKFRIRGEMLDLVRRHAGREGSNSLPQPEVRDSADPDDGVPASRDSSPQSSALKQQRAAIIWEELQRLPARDRAVVCLRYTKEMTLREIGEALHVNESRACQLHQSALGRLKRALSSRGVRDFSHL
jgi:RNA polymerase sigma factor (sigma-70 family)